MSSPRGRVWDATIHASTVERRRSSSTRQKTSIASFPGGLPNVVLVTLLLLSFIPYYLPAYEVPDFWK